MSLDCDRNLECGLESHAEGKLDGMQNFFLVHSVLYLFQFKDLKEVQMWYSNK